MSGYVGFSKSTNAVYAEEHCNAYPASIIAKKLRVKVKAIREILEPSEWHHTSSWFNSTDYYDGRLLIPLANNSMPDRSDYYDEDDLFEAAELLIELRQFQGPKPIGWVKHNVKIDWLEWSGSRNRPKCTERSEVGCKVEFNGKSTYTITLPSGYVFKKRKETNGLHIYD